MKGARGTLQECVHTRAGKRGKYREAVREPSCASLDPVLRRAREEACRPWKPVGRVTSRREPRREAVSPAECCAIFLLLRRCFQSFLRLRAIVP